MKVKVCKSLIEPQERVFQSQSNQSTYYQAVTPTIWNDPICTCPGYIHRGSCKHTQHLINNVCLWNEVDSEAEWCPQCGDPAVDFEMTPEFDERI